MRIQTNMFAVAAGALLMMAVSTSAMGADRSTMTSDAAESNETVASLGKTHTPFMAMKGISATPMSDQELGKVRGQLFPSWVPLSWRLPSHQVNGSNIYVYVSDFGRPMWINCNFVRNGC